MNMNRLSSATDAIAWLALKLRRELRVSLSSRTGSIGQVTPLGCEEQKNRHRQRKKKSHETDHRVDINGWNTTRGIQRHGRLNWIQENCV